MTTKLGSGYSKPYLDTSVYVSVIQNEPSREVGAQILRAAQQGDFPIVASTFVIAELVHARGRPQTITPDQNRKIENLLLNDWVQLVELDTFIARNARRIAWKYGLKPPDAVHLATAIRADADVFLSWDEHFIGKNFEGVECREPYLIGQTEMNLATLEDSEDRISG